LKTVTFLLIIFFFSNLVASDIKWESLILEKMLTSMSSTNKVLIYTKSPKMKKIVEHLTDGKVRVTNNCKKADFALLTEDEKEACDKPEIVFNYRGYLHNQNAVGVFFWQKGRPTIRFSSKRLKYFDLQVRGELSKFVSSNQ